MERRKGRVTQAGCWKTCVIVSCLVWKNERKDIHLSIVKKVHMFLEMRNFLVVEKRALGLWETESKLWIICDSKSSKREIPVDFQQ